MKILDSLHDLVDLPFTKICPRKRISTNTITSFCSFGFRDLPLQLYSTRTLFSLYYCTFMYRLAVEVVFVGCSWALVSAAFSAPPPNSFSTPTSTAFSRELQLVPRIPKDKFDPFQDYYQFLKNHPGTNSHKNRSHQKGGDDTSVGRPV